MKATIRNTMLGAVMMIGMASVGATAQTAQTAEPTFKGDPSVYKVIFEDANFRVIEGTRAAGVHDKPHGHPLPSIVYNVTDCPSKVYAADGKVTENNGKAGAVTAIPVIPSHSAENIGTSVCKQIFIEKK